MFNFFKKKSPAEQNSSDQNTAPKTQLKLKISGMHCTSCSLNIDDSIEEIPGVYLSNTSYAQSLTTVFYNDALVKKKQIYSIIQQLGYTIEKEF